MQTSFRRTVAPRILRTPPWLRSGPPRPRPHPPQPSFRPELSLSFYSSTSTPKDPAKDSSEGGAPSRTWSGLGLQHDAGDGRREEKLALSLAEERRTAAAAVPRTTTRTSALHAGVAGTPPPRTLPQRRPLPEKTRKLVAYRQAYKCALCDCLLPPTYEVDHIVPVAMEGSNGLANLQALCRPCHKQKTRDQRWDIIDFIAGRRLSEEATSVDSNVGANVEAGMEAEAEPRGGIGLNMDPAQPDMNASACTPPLDASPRHHDAPALLLNAQQRAAATSWAPAVRVVAGPGTGKTRVLTTRVAQLVLERNVRPYEILAITHTNRAAREIQERIREDLGQGPAEQIYTGTFHRTCLNILRQDIELLPRHRDLGGSLSKYQYKRGFAVYDARAMLKTVRQCAKDLGVLEDKDVKPTVLQVKDIPSLASGTHLSPPRLSNLTTLVTSNHQRGVPSSPTSPFSPPLLPALSHPLSHPHSHSHS